MKDITFGGWLFIVVLLVALASLIVVVVLNEMKREDECEAIGWDWVSTGRGHLCMKPGTVKK